MDLEVKEVMRAATSKRQQQVDANYEYFKSILPGILHIRRNKFLLLQNCEARGYYDTLSDALEAARVFCPKGDYSIQEVTDKVVDLGHFSHVDPLI
ncbi:MAG: hypothetical protein OXF24_08830 [Hyphomicrobiales bacterium]|nr:hypothetical protein [Hyphomicrobiales bacterium]MCY4052976.1 hypothetical protein [Hyphomicrobiales bacterium]